jgi:LmbE family N-acetylglucosaminyl deacetylase
MSDIVTRDEWIDTLNLLARDEIRNQDKRIAALEAELVALRARAEAAEGLREALQELREATSAVPYAYEYERAYRAMKQADLALVEWEKSKGG